ncbi:MAG TPA: DUF6311 domain-containing protein [Myxococcaceae bacterium]|nr:DUF6311 domain-containing protein [Myxococcaceae bacterium]
MREATSVPAARPMAGADVASAVLGPGLAGAFGFWWFVHWAGLRPLDPTNLSWLLNGEDWGWHLLGGLFFRNEPWGLPLGRIHAFVYPVGTTVGFTDSTPWVAAILKLWSPVLPEGFQYIGPWLALCFVAMGIAGALAVGAFTTSPWLQAIGGALFVTSPVLIGRVGHEALCAQWMLVVPIAMLVAPAAHPAAWRRAIGRALLVSLLAAGIHPYLTAMVVLLSLALIWRLSLVDGLAPIPSAVGASLVLALVVCAVFWLFGFLGGGTAYGSVGFGFYNSDLLALVNPRGQSRWLPDLPAARPHYEGWAFLGTGVLALLAFVLLSLLLRRREAAALPWRRAIPIFIASTLAAFFSFATEINFGRRTLVRLDALYGPLLPVGEMFRATGRFMWIAHYALLAAAVLLCIRLWRGGVVAALALAGALALQIADFSWRGSQVFSLPPIDAGLRSPAWRTLGSEYRHLALVPPQVAYVGGACEGEFPGQFRVPFAYLAYSQRMTIDAGTASRYDEAAVRQACDELQDRIRSGKLDDDTVYVPGPASLRALRASGAKVICGRLDRWAVCVSNARRTRLADELRLNPI